ncbi:tyrosine--tRNA ligase [Cytophaga hutchinsonii]|uniref:Tyrosine--tRNA ligase n=1 Tax=Cytophaga hutchinsonii (strain ATCC 33406 / DSM 1761 / CIP 103989 / NBRC 15051 / NCIMB 9469 / D465) TaxID=269798 RepID=SYY_CYTH3|nr:tyrosine--tRNA ligase [Cytophaga hutchinsonii]Q11UV9.1 RecName: Full=Tyrosine--tRNA ligase; AltName: Full=Tyrosyl-tRNA synthetase; Short=TyrRS [Cytophaga hutchinsonii ATCC 33406]ABG58807.1 tyrosyl-tRNA synthetase [Cytophaga hutchinsonii ATCC 33406]SFX79648.1 tyrosyl-tRNA synthetase [Cytophaga hutchinsonii ATCC 33406]
MKNFVEELKWRGMLHDIMPGTEEYLLKNQTTAYVGFDPTASSLTIGNLVTIMMLVHFQHAGHIPMALVGGATGMIGDPSGRSEERNFLSEETLRLNQEGIRKQLTKFLDFDCGANSAKLVNNYDWFKGIGFLEFLRDAGKHLTVNYMMAKDSVKKRLEVGLTFTEFSYQLLQGYDFCHLYQKENVRLQMGGSDQWGNITSGTELIRRMADGTAFALTTPLLTKADGTKFGKSAGGNIWLDAALTSPYKFYQFWLNSADEDVSRFIRIFTLLSKEAIEALEAEHAKAPHERLLQKTLAKDITIRVHSEEDYEMAIKASEILFGKSVTEDLQALNESTLLSVFEGIPLIEISRSILDEKPSVLDLLSTLTNSEVFPSKGEARKMIQGGGVSINKIKINSSEEIVNYPLLLNNYLLVQKGKKNYYLLRFN